MAIQCITGNTGKFKEIEALLGVGNVTQLNIDLPEIQELDAKIIIQKKLEAAFAHTQGEFIVEDTSLYFEGLHSELPGPLIKWFLKTLGTQGLADLASKLGNTAAVAQTMLGYAKSPFEIIYFEGSLRGNIVSPRGEGFGWDSIFEVQGSGKTFGEMAADEKNSISHRYQAIQKLKDFLGI